MSSLWRGNLRNTATDVIIDTILLILCLCVYIPQIYRIRTRASTRGISPYYVLFNVFFSNAQLSEILFWTAYAWPTDTRPVLEEIGNGDLRGMEAFGGILGLLQIFVQWSCSITVLTTFAVGSPPGDLKGRNISIIAFLHAATVLFPIVAIALPRPAAHEYTRDIMMVLIDMSNVVVAPCFVVLQFYAQFWEMINQTGKAGALSLVSVGLQALIIAAMGFRWLLRLGKPTWGRVAAPIWLWYQWSFPATNYFLHAMGCAFLLASYFFAARGVAEYDDLGKRGPLLG